MSRLRTHMQDATSRLGAGTVLAHQTCSTGLGSKNDFHALSCLAQARTGLPRRTRGLACGPINREVREIEAFACFGLPTTVRHGRTDECDPPLLAVGKQLCIDV